MPIYATKTDLPDGMTVPDNADALLAYASSLVDDLLLTAVYVVDSDGMPEDPQLRDVFRTVVVSQVRTWATLGVDPTLGAAGITSDRRASSKSIGSGSISYETSSRADDDRVQAVMGLGQVPMAMIEGAIRNHRIEVRW